MLRKRVGPPSTNRTGGREECLAVQEQWRVPQRQGWSLQNGLVSMWREGGSGGERFTVAQRGIYYCAFQIEEMEISLPNIHYLNIDMSKMGLINKEEVRTFKIFKAHLPSSPLSLIPLYKLRMIQSPTKTIKSRSSWFGNIYSHHRLESS